jgi:hypothetical protein
LDLFSGGRMGPSESRGFSAAQIEQIRRTVRGRTPEVMVKVTGGGTKLGAVAAHFSYISQHGELEIQTDRGEHVTEDGRKALFKGWHLDLSAGQYRGPRGTKAFARPVKLVHNIVLSMPSPTAMLREWRQDVAQEMRRQGIAANATPRSVRRQTKQATKDVFYRTQARGQSYTLREKVDGIVHGLSETNSAADPARTKLLATRKAIVQGWTAVADKLEAQGEIVLGGDVRYFATHLPPVLTDRERLAAELIQFAKERRSARARGDGRVRDRTLERTR